MFEYGNPDAILAELLPTLKPNEAGHTALDDFEHFATVPGCPIDDKWAKLAFAWEWTRKRELEANSAKAAELVASALGMIDAPRDAG